MQAYRRKRASGGYVHYYRCRPSTTLILCPNRKSHRALELEHEAVWMFQQFASMDMLLELYDRAVEEEEKRTGLHGSLERREALSERLGVLAKMRRGFQDQQAEGLMTRPELRERLAKLDEEKEQVAAGLRAVEDATSTARRIGRRGRRWYRLTGTCTLSTSAPTRC